MTKRKTAMTKSYLRNKDKVEQQTEKYGKSIHLVNESNNEKDYKANKDDKMDYDDDCNGRLECKNKSVQNCTWKKVEVIHTKDGKDSGLFAMEDIATDDSIIEYMGKIKYKRRENNYVMKINGLNLWINGDEMVDQHNT